MPFHFVPIEVKTLNALNLFDHIICLSKFGKNLLIETEKNVSHFNKENKNVSFIPHFIDFDYLYKKNTLNSDLLRNTLFKDKEYIEGNYINDKIYLITYIAKNSEESNRKAFDMNILAFKKLIDKGFNAYLYIHSIFDGTCNLFTIINYYKRIKYNIIGK